MRAEKIKRYLIRAMTFLLLAIVPLGYVRVLLGTGGLTKDDYEQACEVRCTIVNSVGEVLYDGRCQGHTTYGNIIGDNGQSVNTVSERHQDEMKYTGLTPWGGVDSLNEKSVRHIHTTLVSDEVHQKIQGLFGEYNGACYVYNYKTGEIYMALSLPSQLPYEVEAKDLPEGALINKCFLGYYIPGSIIKVLAAVCALDQGEALRNFKHTCTGSLELPDGEVVTCLGVHGEVDMEKALGVSCNAYVAALVTQMDAAQTRQLLEKMGFSTTAEVYRDWQMLQNAGLNVDVEAQRGLADRMQYRLSKTVFTTSTDEDSVWGLVGQGKSEVNLIHMAMLAGAVANDGQAANPYLIQKITKRGDKVAYSADSGSMVELIPADTARMADEIWHGAVEKYYRSGGNQLVEQITHAKTGTAQQGAGADNRALLGVMEEYDVAFCIVVEGLGNNSNLHIQIANKLAELMASTR